MNISREQIIRFFKKECTAEEAVAVSEFLKNNPEAAAALLPEEEWQDTGNDAGKPDAYWNEVWEDVRPAGKPKVMGIWRKIAAAAVLTGGIALAWYTFSPEKGTAPPVAGAAYAGRELINNGGSVMRYTLEDSSVVELMAGAVVRYDPAFGNGKRDMYLTGEAIFHTRGDVHRPFTVYSDGLAVTALGTVFSVSSAMADGTTGVKLLEGKVVVKAADTLLAQLDKDYYLQPGDELSFSRENGIAILRKQAPAPAVKQKDAGANKQHEVNSWYMFENQGLAQVFEQLGAIYGERIYYNPAELQGLNFIGKIDQADSLQNILRDIAMLNNLTVTKNRKGYIIKAQ